MTSGRRLAQLWLVSFQIQMDAAVVPDFQVPCSELPN